MATSIRPSIMPRPLLYRSAEDYLARRSRYQYGRRGTPTSEALSEAIAELEGPSCAGVALLPSGLAACSIALMAMLKAGDHVLVTDNVYQPTRILCDGTLSRQNVSTNLLRSADRWRHCVAVQTKHTRRLSRIARIAVIRESKMCPQSRQRPMPMVQSS